MDKPHVKSSGRIEDRGPRRQVLTAGVLRRLPQLAFQMLCLTLLLGMQESAQQGEPATPTHNQFPSLASQRSMGGDVDFPTDDPVWQEKQLRVLNIERQKALVSDTNKLLKLAHDLDAEVSGTTSDSLTPDQIRTLAEIEKLAHSVKEKMSISLQRPSFQQQNPAFPQRDPVIPTMTP